MHSSFVSIEFHCKYWLHQIGTSYTVVGCAETLDS